MCVEFSEEEGNSRAIERVVYRWDIAAYEREERREAAPAAATLGR